MRRTVQISQYVLIIALFSAYGVGTQTVSLGDVSGVVTATGTGKALEGATIEIGGKTATTTAGGLYLIENVTSGLKELTATLNGYDAYAGSCRVSEDTLVNCNVQLNHAANNVGGVLVSAEFIPEDAVNNQEIDVIQNRDCDGNAATADPEPLFDTKGLLSITLESLDGSPIPKYFFTSYYVDYIPLASPTPHDDVFNPPELPGFSELVGIALNSDAPTSVPITLMPFATKESFIAVTPYLGAKYSMRVTLFVVSEYGREAVVNIESDILLANFDNCM